MRSWALRPGSQESGSGRKPIHQVSADYMVAVIGTMLSAGSLSFSSCPRRLECNQGQQKRTEPGARGVGLSPTPGVEITTHILGVGFEPTSPVRDTGLASLRPCDCALPGSPSFETLGYPRANGEPICDC